MIIMRVVVAVVVLTVALTVMAIFVTLVAVVFVETVTRNKRHPNILSPALLLETNRFGDFEPMFIGSRTPASLTVLR